MNKGNLLSTSLTILVVLLVWPSSTFTQEDPAEVGLDNNGYLEILKIRKHKQPEEIIRGVDPKTRKPIVYTSDERFVFVEVLVKVLQELPEGKPHKVCIHYYDSNEESLPGDSQYTEKDLSTGEIRSMTFNIPENAKTFKVWLPEIK